MFLDHTQLDTQTHTHTHTHTHTRLNSSESVINSSQRPLPAQNKTNTRDKDPYLERDSNQQSNSCIPTPYTARPSRSACFAVTRRKILCVQTCKCTHIVYTLMWEWGAQCFGNEKNRKFYVTQAVKQFAHTISYCRVYCVSFSCAYFSALIPLFHLTDFPFSYFKCLFLCLLHYYMSCFYLFLYFCWLNFHSFFLRNLHSTVYFFTDVIPFNPSYIRQNWIDRPGKSYSPILAMSGHTSISKAEFKQPF